MNVSTKFDIIPLSGLSKNALKPKSVMDEGMNVQTDRQAHSYSPPPKPGKQLLERLHSEIPPAAP